MRDDGTYSLSVRVTDVTPLSGDEESDRLIGQFTDAFSTITITNADPELGSVAATRAGENGFTILSGTITDPGVFDSFTLLVDWGDGSAGTFSYDAGSMAFSETHRYLDDGVYALTLTLTDDDGGQDTAATSVSVDNMAPVIESLSATSVDENGVVHLTGAYSDIGTLDTHTLTINWGEGSPEAVSVSGGARPRPRGRRCCTWIACSACTGQGWWRPGACGAGPWPQERSSVSGPTVRPPASAACRATTPRPPKPRSASILTQARSLSRYGTTERASTLHGQESQNRSLAEWGC